MRSRRAAGPPLLPLLLVLPALLAGCTTDGDPPRPDDPSLVFVAGRLDMDGDGLFDAVNITLVAAPGPLARERLSFAVDGRPVDVGAVLGDELAWSPGRDIQFACTPGTHEFEVRLDGRVRELVVLECGVAPSAAPPLFEGRVVDGDADGQRDAYLLTLIDNGPVDPRELRAAVGDHPLRFYDDPFKSRLARGPVGNGSRIYTPCVPGEDALSVTWRDQRLPTLRLTGCEVFMPGVDAPLSVQPLDVDRDGAQDGWRFVLGNGTDGPFGALELAASWGNASAVLNGSVGLAPPAFPWAAGGELVISCPGDAGGARTFELFVHETLVFRSATPCEVPPGRPLVELVLAAGVGDAAGTLAAELTFSRVGPLDQTNVTDANGTHLLEPGSWEEGETRELACPGGELILRYEGRRAYRGTAPC